MFRLGPTELLVILGIVLLLFGVGRIGKVGGELGSAIREFRKALGGGKKEEDPAAPQAADTTQDPLKR